MKRFKLSVVLFFILVLVSSCKDEPKTFIVYTDFYCKKLTSEFAQIDRCWPLFSQLHSPLFELTSTGIGSSLLADWSTSSDNTHYKFCLKRDVKFSSGRPLSSHHIKENLLRFSEQGSYRDKILKIETTKNCISLKFKKPHNDYLKTLSAPEMAIVHPDSFSDDFPDGISVYKLLKYSEEEIVLKARDGISAYFNKIRYINISVNRTSNLPMPHEVNFMDFSNIKRSNKGMSKYFKYLPNMTYLILNLPNPSLRKSFVSCFERDSFLKVASMITSNRSMITPNSFIPKGLRGYKDLPTKHECKALKEPIKLKYLNVYGHITSTLQDFFTKFRKKTNIEVEIIPLDKNEIANTKNPLAPLSREKNYDLLLIGIGVNNPMAYFRGILGEINERLIKEIPPELVISYKKLLNSDLSYTLKNEAYEHLNMSVIDKKLAIPLYQIKKEFYYPSNLRGLDNYLTSKMGYYHVSKLYEE